MFTRPLTTNLTSSLNPANFGQSVTRTATVDPSAATGTVSFQDSSEEIGTGTLAGRSAPHVRDALSVGSHNLTAVYAGDGNMVFSFTPPARLGMVVVTGRTGGDRSLAVGPVGDPWVPVATALFNLKSHRPR